MATTNFREDFMGRDLVAPTVNATDYLGRLVTATVDTLGQSLRRAVRANTTAVTLNQEIQFTTGEKFICHGGRDDRGVTARRSCGGCHCGRRWRDIAATEVT